MRLLFIVGIMVLAMEILALAAPVDRRRRTTRE
jgi:hypothetical protein